MLARLQPNAAPGDAGIREIDLMVLLVDDPHRFFPYIKSEQNYAVIWRNPAIAVDIFPARAAAFLVVALALAVALVIVAPHFGHFLE